MSIEHRQGFEEESVQFSSRVENLEAAKDIAESVKILHDLSLKYEDKFVEEAKEHGIKLEVEETWPFGVVTKEGKKGSKLDAPADMGKSISWLERRAKKTGFEGLTKEQLEVMPSVLNKLFRSTYYNSSAKLHENQLALDAKLISDAEKAGRGTTLEQTLFRLHLAKAKLDSYFALLEESPMLISEKLKKFAADIKNFIGSEEN